MFFMAIGNKADKLKVERLYYQYCNLMYGEAYKILNDRYLAEDAVSESFIRIINNLHKINEDNCPRTCSFLVIICRNVAIDIYNSRKNVNFDAAEELSIPELCENTTPEDIVIDKESVERMTEAIMNLDQKYRDIFLLKRVYGLSREDIASICGISIETVKKRLFRARKMIVSCLERSNADADR